MSDLRPVDPPASDPLHREVEAWLRQRREALADEFQAACARLVPDADLAERLRRAVPSPPPSAGSAFADALDLVEGAATQSDLLKRLLDALAPLAGRSALFILRQGLASLYAHRGFDPGAPPPTGAVVPPPELEAVIQGSARAIRSKGPAYAALLAALSAPEAADLAILPLRHKRKTVALLLMDSGAQPALDHPEFLRALVLAASATLASLAAAAKEETSPHLRPGGFPTPSAPTQALPESLDGLAEPELDGRTRASAERLARVLVSDVELYFPAKVAQGRTHGDLYRLLRDELERSRATFVDRFGEPLEARHRIFTTTVIQHLCEGDASKLGTPSWA
ncbi:hypothetical protein [Geothrix sp. 21YS21S-4]|uniref:hypothetical protein n=1 Tax=Geothrix sp. 21YS21S-4 TaxID=3068889 RepID=UPI0027BA5697|nr:hypothetical protein [Geothrix sp. 21YS21S-4]